MISACAHSPLTDFRFQTTMAPPYVVANWYRIEAPGEPLRVYIEGDGHAFDKNGQPTDNPTPKSELWRQIAAADPNPNVAYIGRPCQYLQAGACTQKDWTTGRFSEPVINGMDTVIQSLRQKARTDKVTLIGYSGGAQVAGLIAVRHPEQVADVITVAGVLDTAAWTTHHGDAPLVDSLNLRDSREHFQTLPQHHFVGGRDTVVPPFLTQDFVADDSRITVVPRATHHKGWHAIQDDIYERIP